MRDGAADPAGLTPEQQRIHRLLAGIDLPQFAERLEQVALRVAGHPRDGQLPEDQRLRPRIETQLAPDAVVADVVRRVSDGFDEVHVLELERFDASPLGRKVDAAADAPYSWLSRLGYRMFGSGPNAAPERVALVEKLDALTLSSRTSIDLYMTVYEAIVRWYDKHGFIDPKESAGRRRHRRAARARARAGRGDRDEAHHPLRPLRALRSLDARARRVRGRGGVARGPVVREGGARRADRDDRQPIAGDRTLSRDHRGFDLGFCWCRT